MFLDQAKIVLKKKRLNQTGRLIPLKNVTTHNRQLKAKITLEYFSSYAKLGDISCYTIQLMHYSHFKTQSLQHLKPIKC